MRELMIGIALAFLLVVPMAACGGQDAATTEHDDEEIVDSRSDDSGVGPAETLKIVPDPDGGVYLGSFPITHDHFEGVIGRPLSMKGEDCAISFAVEDGEEVHRLPEVDIDCLQSKLDQGQVVRLGMEPWFCRTTPAEFTVQGVIDGQIDEELRAVARSLSEWGGPVFWGYSVEPAVQWPGHGTEGQDCRWRCDDVEGFPGGICDDTPESDPAEHYTGYGDPRQLDSVERYVDYHRHIHDVMEEEIARLGLPSNLTYLAGHGTDGPEGYSYPQYCIGDDYVDWHAYGYYAGATLEPGGNVSGCLPFPGNLDEWNQVLALGDKPVMLDEFGVSREFFGEPSCTDRGAWLAGFFDDLVTKYPQVGMLNYVEADIFPWATAIQPDDPAAIAWQTEMTNHPARWPECLALSNGSAVCP